MHLEVFDKEFRKGNIEFTTSERNVINGALGVVLFEAATTGDQLDINSETARLCDLFVKNQENRTKRKLTNVRGHHVGIVLEAVESAFPEDIEDINNPISLFVAELRLAERTLTDDQALHVDGPELSLEDSTLFQQIAIRSDVLVDPPDGTLG